ncbi:MAG: ribonuclease H-like domain-containing protein [Deltaproteobacteria bacterium]|nr:ribonuclease H-like domain-containing protein [Deltaproteobacteria bacterium]
MNGESEKDRVLRELRERTKAIIGREEIPPDTPCVEPEGARVWFAGSNAVTPHGSAFVTETRFEPGDIFGLCRLSDFVDAPLGDLARWSGQHWLADLRARDLLFFDIETAGAPGNPAMFAFLTGLGGFEDRAFVVRQVFAEDPDDEAACMHAVAEIVAKYAALVSFNGIGFDVPVLAGRMRRMRLDPTVMDRPHLDLLPYSRRLWRGAFDNCRLATLEHEVVGHARVGDVPGVLIPSIYEDYLTHKDVRRIRAVFDHNIWDVAAMPALALRMARCAAASSPDAEDLSPAESAAIGRDRLARGEIDAATVFLDHGRNARGKIGRRAAEDLVKIYKTTRRMDEAVALWQGMIDRQEAEGEFDPHPYIELAKYREHWEGQYQAALDVAARAESRCPTEKKHWREDLAKRTMRLRWRLAGKRTIRQ